MLIAILIVVVLLSIGAFPAVGWNTNLGYYPSGVGLIVVLVLLYLLLRGRV